MGNLVKLFPLQQPYRPKASVKRARLPAPPLIVAEPFAFTRRGTVTIVAHEVVIDLSPARAREIAGKLVELALLAERLR